MGRDIHRDAIYTKIEFTKEGDIYGDRIYKKKRYKQANRVRVNIEWGHI